jgi:hypothetical protein
MCLHGTVLNYLNTGTTLPLPRNKNDKNNLKREKTLHKGLFPSITSSAHP